MKIGSFSLIKELNTSLILNTIKERKSVSRADIAKITGLTAATVTNITAELLKYNLIIETKYGESSGGRKPILLEFNYKAYSVVGVVVTKEEITVALTDLNANLLDKSSLSLAENVTDTEVIDSICKAINNLKLSSYGRVLGIGVSMEGLINEKDGVCVLSSSFGWENVEIRSRLSENLKLPVFVNNDVKALAKGEEMFGRGKESSNFILLYIGYGIGATLVNEGIIYRGASNYASEIGHITLDMNGPLCNCGNKGCFQALASGEALINELKKNGYGEIFGDEGITLKSIPEKSVSGEHGIEQLIEKQAYYIGTGVANIINIFNPSDIIISGYISAMPEKIKELIIKEAKKKSLKSMRDDINITFSKMGIDGQYKGAVGLIISELFDNPEFFF